MRGNYILFSGGYDSSYLIAKTLTEIKENNLDDEVNLISIYASFSFRKSDREKNAREKLLNYWRAKFHMININHAELKIDVNDFSLNTAKTGLTQPNFWLSALLCNIDYSRYDEINILFSYICGDQAIVYKHEIESICKASYNLANSETPFDVFNKLSKPKINILFPLSIAHKEDVLSGLIMEDTFVFETCTTCESPEEKEYCNDCEPCKHFKSALLNLLNDKTEPDKVNSFCVEKLKNFDNVVLEPRNENDIKINCATEQKYIIRNS